MEGLRKIVIIDDEPLIVSGLAKNIDWHAIGGEVVGTACNGEAALQVIEETIPDIVISDIVMPLFTGLQLAETCGLRYPNTKIILLSAYSDFEYAREAIRLNVVDYVLKPIEPEKLMAAVQRAIEELRQQEGLFSHVSKLERENMAAWQLAASFLLFESAQKGIASPGAQEQLQRNAEELVQKPGIVVALRFYNIPRANPAAHIAAGTSRFLVAMKESGMRLFSRTEETGVTVLCQFADRLPPQEDMEFLGEKIRKAIDAIGTGTDAAQMLAVCVFTPPYHDALELKRTYQKCIKQVQRGFFAQANGVFPLEAEAANAGPETENNPDLVVHALKNGSSQQLCQELDLVLDRARESCDPDAASLLLRTLHREAMRVCALCGITAVREEEAVCEQETFAEKSRRLRKWLLSISAYLENSRDLVQKTQQLIQTRFSDSGFGLAAAADQMQVSTSYLSRLFKKKTGENFIDSLLTRRLEQARFLLTTTSMNVAQIAEKVGFAESAYFAQVFKKTCGCTPSQYRERTQAAKRS